MNTIIAFPVMTLTTPTGNKLISVNNRILLTGVSNRCDDTPGPDPPAPTATSYIISSQPVVTTTTPEPSSDDPPASSEIITSVPGTDTVIQSSGSVSSPPASNVITTGLIYTSGPLPSAEPTTFPPKTRYDYYL